MFLKREGDGQPIQKSLKSWVYKISTKPAPRYLALSDESRPIKDVIQMELSGTELLSIAHTIC